MKQAKSDLRHEHHARDDRDYDWAAFGSHQAAEKAIKPLFQKMNLHARGHMLSVLLDKLHEHTRPAASLIDRAKELDKHCIPDSVPEWLRAPSAGGLLHTRRGRQGNRAR